MLQDDQDDCLNFNHFDVFYSDWDGHITSARFVAEDEDHARDIFSMFYPRVDIIEVVDRGAAF